MHAVQLQPSFLFSPLPCQVADLGRRRFLHFLPDLDTQLERWKIFLHGKHSKHKGLAQADCTMERLIYRL